MKFIPKLISFFTNKRSSKSALFGLAMLAAFFFSPTQSKASHIIGGEMNYTCMGGDEYEITLTVYRDCFYADPGAFFDDRAAIGIFDGSNNLVDSLLLPLMNNDTLTPILSDPCLFVPDDVCVHTTTYRRVMNLPFRPGGYRFAYQRCCRNETINNIVDPSNTGVTFESFLSEQALIECNSGASYVEWPPLFICVNEPIEWNHSAVDSDGDSLVYTLCTPNLGADFDNPKPQPPNNPPYDDVVWNAGFDENNPLGGSNPLTIDPVTGILTGTPNTIGQFVVGICIEEYRDGVLIATNTRDFQYNVGQCLKIETIIANELVQCEDLSVDFINTSQLANNFLWEFGDPENPTASSTEFEPSYVYPDTGFYDVVLIGEPNGACADTFMQTIYLKESTLSTAFNHFVLDCVDSVVVSTSNTSFDTYSNIVEYNWTLSDGQTSNEQNPIFAISETDDLTLTLEAVADDGCTATLSESFFVNVLGGGETRDTLTICPGGSISLNNSPFIRQNVVYEWSPAIGLSSADSPNPFASPTETTEYTVSITDTVNDCTGGFKVLVQIQENGGAILTSDSTFCSPNINLVADSTNLVSMTWANVNDLDNTLGNASSLTVPSNGTETFQLTVLDELGCTFTDNIEVSGGLINTEINVADLACVGTELTLESTNNVVGQNLTYAWSGDLSIESADQATATMNLTTVGEQTFSLTVENQFGCTQTITQNVMVLDATSPTSIGMSQDCAGYEYTFTNTHFNSAYYEWDFGDANNPDVVTGPTASHTFTADGTYTVTLAPIAGLPCTLDAYQIEIQVPTQTAQPAYELEVVDCGGGNNPVEIQFTDMSQTFQGTITEWFWDFGNGITATTENPSVSFTAPNVSVVELTITTDEGCSITSPFNLDLAPYFIDLTGMDLNQSRCSANAYSLNPNANTAYSYVWSPANAVDNPTAANPISTATESTMYTVQVTNEYGCVVTQEVQLEVPTNLLTADFSWAYSDCIAEAVVDFTAVPPSYAGAIASIDWTYGTAEANDVLEFTTTIDTNQELPVTLELTAEDGCVATLTQTVNITLLDFNLPESALLCNGLSIELNTGGNEDYAYTWGPATAVEDVSATMPIVSPTETTTYTVTVFDAVTGCEAEESILIEVSEELEGSLELVYADCSNSAVGTLMNTTTYSLDIDTVSWLIDGVPSTGESANFAYTENTTMDVQMIVMATDGCIDTLQQDVDVNIIDFELANQSLTICNGTPTELNPNGNPDLVYTWESAEGLSDLNSMNPLANPTESTYYTVSITDPTNGTCEVVQQILADVPVYNAEVAFTAQSVACEDGLSVQFTNVSTFEDEEVIDWYWEFNGVIVSHEAEPVFEFDMDQTIAIQLIVNTADGCTYTMDEVESMDASIINTDFLDAAGTNIDNCAGQPIGLNPNGNPAYQYQWAPVADLSNANAMNPMASPLETTTYTVTITSNNGFDTCEVVREVTVSVDAIDLSFLQSGVLACTGTSVPLNNNAIGNYSYNWNPSTTLDDATAENPIATPTATTTYTVTITDQSVADGCDYFSEVTVIVPQAPALEAIGEENNCEDEVTLTALVNPTYAVQWSNTNDFSTTLGNTIDLDIVTDVLGQEYFVQVTDDNGCTNIDSLTIYNRAVDVELMEMDVACVGDTFTVQSINLDPTDELTYVWGPTAPIFSGQGTDAIEIIPTGNTTFSLTATNQFDCNTTESIDVMVTDLSDQIEIFSTLDTIFAGEQVQLSSNDNFGVSYEWAPPIYLDNPNSATPIATPDETTMFILGLQDEEGCVGTATYLLTVLPSTCEEPFVFLPNSFTPNGDGTNDIIYVEGHPIMESHLVIFNRWGQKVFESFNKKDGWDGTCDGVELEPDVYGYYLEIKCFNGDDYFKKGNISLLR